MKAMVLIAVAALGLAVSPAGAQGPPAEIAAQWAGHPPENPDAYFVLKQELGDGGVWDVQSELAKLAYQEAGIPFGATFSGCRFPDWYSVENAGFELARASADAQAWQDNSTRVEAVAARREAIHDRVKAGETVDAAYAGAAGAYLRAKTETDARKAELARRVGEDQFQRANSQVVQSRSLWAADVTPALDSYYREAQSGEMCRTDRANTAWLKADLAAHGWPKISLYGPQADSDAWLLVQHADHDAGFQASVLGLIEGLLPAGDTLAQNYAYLYDRVAIGGKRPQRYGTQGRCTGPGTWAPYASEDPEGLDKRRAEVGLNSEADYIKVFTFCTAELAAMSGG